MTPGPDNDNLAIVLAFVQKFANDRRNGAALSLADYQRQFPGYDDVIASHYARLSTAEDQTGDEAEDDDEQRIGPYRIVKEIARGGQGVVYLGYDERLKREVAIKVLRQTAGLDTSALLRFAREAEITARLENPRICPIYDTGTEAGAAWIVMRHIDGETLAERIASEREANAETTTNGRTSRGWLDERLRIAEKLLRALHEAHEAGVVHRDIKPSNVMIDRQGEPVILDFGLARGGADDGVTLTGDVLGTPAYMAPEQIEGRAVDRRTDVYGLGVTLFECLALERPFDAPTREQLYKNILEGRRRHASQCNRRVPRVLDTVLSAATAVDPRQRYQSALDFAEDLRRVREHEPVRVRRPPALVRLALWVRRNPFAAALVVSLVAGLTAVTFLNLSLTQTQAQTQQALTRVRTLALSSASAQARTEDPYLAMLLAREAVKLEPCSESLTPLYLAMASLRLEHEYRFSEQRTRCAGISPAGDKIALGFEHGALLCDLEDGSVIELDGHEGMILSVTWSPGDDYVLTTSMDQTACLWTNEGELVCRIDRHRSPVVSGFFSPDGTWFGTRGISGRVGLWNLDGGLKAVLRKRAQFSEVRVGPHADVIATASRQGDVDIWATSGQMIRTFHSGIDHTRIRMHPDGKRVLFTEREGLRIASIDTGESQLIRFDERILSFQVSPTGDRAIALGAGKKLFFDLAAGELQRLPTADPTPDAAFTNDGSLLVLGTVGGEIHGYDRAGRRVMRFRGYTRGHHFLAVKFGRLIAAGAESTRVLSLRTSLEAELRSVFGPIAQAVPYSGESPLAAVHSLAGLHIINRSDGETWSVPLPSGAVDSIVRSNDRTRILVLASQWTKLIDGEGKEIAHFAGTRRGSFAPQSDVMFLTGEIDLYDRNPRQMFSGTEQEHVYGHLHDRDGRELVSLRGHGDRGRGPGVFAPSGDQVAYSATSAVLVWDRDGKLVRRLDCGDAYCKGVSGFTDDGVILTVHERFARLWNGDGKEITKFEGSAEMAGAWFSPDDRYVVATFADSTAKVWTAEGKLVATVHGNGDAFVDARFAEDLETIVTLDLAGNQQLWRRDGTQIATLTLPGNGSSFSILETDRVWGQGPDDEAIRWPLDPRKLIDLAEKRSFRDFNPTERERFHDLLTPSKAQAR